MFNKNKPLHMKSKFQLRLVAWFVGTYLFVFLISLFSLQSITLSDNDEEINARLDSAISSIDQNETNRQEIIKYYDSTVEQTLNYVDAAVSHAVDIQHYYLYDYNLAIEYFSLYHEVFQVNMNAISLNGNVAEYETPFADDGSKTSLEKETRFEFLNATYIVPMINHWHSVIQTGDLYSAYLITNVELPNNSKRESIITGGYTPGNIGFNMYSGEQSETFIYSVFDEEGGLYIQDIKDDVSTGLPHLYAGNVIDSELGGTGNKGVIQIDLDPNDYLHALNIASTQTVAAPFVIGNNGFITVSLFNHEDGRYYICGITKFDNGESLQYLGKSLNDVGILINDNKPNTYFDTNAFGIKSRCMMKAAVNSEYYIHGFVTYNEINSITSSSLAILSISALFIFIIVFFLVSILVQKQVINGIYKINNSLNKITDGDLNVVMNENINHEFIELSDGINVMVDSMKASIEKEKNRLDADLTMAKSIQTSVLPSLFPPYPKRVDILDLYASMNAAKEVGGDFYDFFFIDGDRLIILVADVSGKGIPASLFMMRAKSIFKAFAESRKYSFEEVVAKTNESLCAANDANMFVTMFAAMIYTSTGVMEYVNAGHNFPLIRNNGVYRYLDDNKPGFVLAAIDGYKYKKYTMQLEHGDILYMYTDGVTEATNINGDFYSDPYLLDQLNSIASNNEVKEINDLMLESVKTFAGEADQADDITQLVFIYK